MLLLSAAPPVDESRSDFMKIDISVSIGKSSFGLPPFVVLISSETGFQPSCGDLDVDFYLTIVWVNK